MATAANRLLFLLCTTNLLVLLSTSAAGATTDLDIRVDLIHVDAHRNLTLLERLQRAIHRGSNRFMSLRQGSTKGINGTGMNQSNIQSPVHTGSGEFLMNLAIGTPPLPFLAIVDTGSDLIWTQCSPCTNCFTQSSPIFDPSNSSSFSKLPCSSPLCSALPSSTCTPDCAYLYTYGDSSTTQGILGSETFTFGSDNKTVSVDKIGFGCGEDNEGNGFKQAAGLVGLGRGPLSLISQVGSSLYKQFSYCLTSIDDADMKTSRLIFGSAAVPKNLNDSKVAVTTPMVVNDAHPSFYYLELKGISVGGKRLRIPRSVFRLNPDGTGGLIIDSGTTMTYLEAAAYRQMRKAFIKGIDLPVADSSAVGLDLCFTSPSTAKTVEVPALTFHFQGGHLDLPGNNYFILDDSTGLFCLAMMPSSGMSILGNIQQQNFHILYDLHKNMVTFTPAQCDQL
ncbi:aspartic proteinase nepenthesin-1 [Nymphaea colorata]|nr:aspartic proteinase nepenthesin-1 [Nymphaea colorata]